MTQQMTYQKADLGDVLGDKHFAGINIARSPSNSEIEIDPHYTFRSDLVADIAYVHQYNVNRAPGGSVLNLWIGGPKGSGKTSGVEQFLARCGISPIAITCSEGSNVKAWVSSTEAQAGTTIEMLGPIGIAMQQGIPVILNEAHKVPPKRFSELNEILDKGRHVTDKGVPIVAEPGFYIVVTANTMGMADRSGLYPGSLQQDDSLLDRFNFSDLGYMSEADERRLCKRVHPSVADEVIDRFVKVAVASRASFQKGLDGITTPISTRVLLRWIGATSAYQHLSRDPNVLPPLSALRACYARRLEGPSQEAVIKLADGIFRTGSAPKTTT